MRVPIIGAVVALALIVAGAAGAGGWATVGVSPDPPDAAGTAWNVKLRVLQHGRTPLDGVKPSITIRNVDTGEAKTFAARPAGEPGMYRADVKFPSAGTWRYEVNDGFTEYGGGQTHTFAPVEIAPGGDSSSPTWTIAGTAVLGLAFAALLLAGLRPRRPALAASAQ